MCVCVCRLVFYFSIRARGRDVAVGPGGRRLRIGEGVVGSGPSVVVGRTPYANQGPHVHITSLQNALYTGCVPYVYVLVFHYIHNTLTVQYCEHQKSCLRIMRTIMRECNLCWRLGWIRHCFTLVYTVYQKSSVYLSICDGNVQMILV